MYYCRVNTVLCKYELLRLCITRTTEGTAIEFVTVVWHWVTREYSHELGTNDWATYAVMLHDERMDRGSVDIVALRVMVKVSLCVVESPGDVSLVPIPTSPCVPYL